jgi:hypothetical protein
MSGDISRGRLWREWCDPVVMAAMALGVALRAAGLSHGLPLVYNPDEVSILSRALALGSGDLNPHNFLYPSLFFYLLAAAVGALAGLEWMTGQVSSLAVFEAHFWRDPTAVYLVARSISVLSGVLTIFATWRLALTVGTRTSARVAAVLMAVAYVPVRDAHFVKHDVPATLLILLAVLASRRVWQPGRTRDYALAGAVTGVASALHYYAVFAVVPLLCAHGLHAGPSWRRWLSPRLWLAAAASLAAFAVCSPYVILDWPTALRDIQANRLIIVDRARQAYGLFGSAIPQLRILAAQGTGVAWLAAAVVGFVAMARTSRATALWLVSFPAVFIVFISNTWPYGRTANPLYPFLAVFAAGGIVFLSQWFRRSAAAGVIILTVVAAATPLVRSITLVHLLRQTDTRTLAGAWVEANIPAGSSVAVEPYSVQLVPTKAQLTAALAHAGIQPARAGRRARALLARDPYPTPAYGLFYLGDGGLDEDKLYVTPAALAKDQAAPPASGPCVEYVILKNAAPSGPNALSAPVARLAVLVHRDTPFRESDPGLTADGFLPDFDVPPSLAVLRPGPVIEIWRTSSPCGNRERCP